jgi:hypothetical protein
VDGGMKELKNLNNFVGLWTVKKEKDADEEEEFLKDEEERKETLRQKDIGSKLKPINQ